MLLYGLALASLLVPAAFGAPAGHGTHDLFTRNNSSATGGAVASEVAECSEIGITILKQGGNAADATIATGLCVGTINAFHSGIGGGGECFTVEFECRDRRWRAVRYRTDLGADLFPSPSAGFGIVRFNKDDGSHDYETIDFRETMPAAGNVSMYASDANGSTLSTIGGLAVGVPGELRGWEALHNRHGKLPW